MKIISPYQWNLQDLYIEFFKPLLHVHKNSDDVHQTKTTSIYSSPELERKKGIRTCDL